MRTWYCKSAPLWSLRSIFRSTASAWHALLSCSIFNIIVSHFYSLSFTPILTLCHFSRKKNLWKQWWFIITINLISAQSKLYWKYLLSIFTVFYLSVNSTKFKRRELIHMIVCLAFVLNIQISFRLILFNFIRNSSTLRWFVCPHSMTLTRAPNVHLNSTMSYLIIYFVTNFFSIH